MLRKPGACVSARLTGLPGLLMAALCLCAPAAADQAAYITRDQAERAAARIEVDSEIRHFAPPAGDTRWRAERVQQKTVAHTGFENFYELRINGAGVDLAYVYVPEDERWVNLALALGLDVSDVPRYLGEDPAEEATPARAHYRGAIGDDLRIHMDLTRDAGRLYGFYEYLSKGLPLDLAGEIEDDGTFTLAESVDGQKTGVFVGKLEESSGRLQGTWANPDGSRSLPFRAERYARADTLAWKATAGRVAIEGEAAYPVFLLEDRPAAKALADLFSGDLASRYAVFEEDARDIAADFPEEAGPRAFVFDASDYSIEYFSPRVISVAYEVFTDTGGAHPNHFSRVFNLSIGADGSISRLELSNLFKAGAEYGPELSKRIIADLRRQEAQWVLDGEVKELSPEELSGFVLTPRGLRFLFDPYAVGPYVQGSFIVDIPYKDLPGLREDLDLPAAP